MNAKEYLSAKKSKEYENKERKLIQIGNLFGNEVC